MATAKINNLKFQIYKSFPNFTCSLEILDTIIISIIYLDALTSQRNNTTWYTTLKYFFGYRIQGVKSHSIVYVLHFEMMIFTLNLRAVDV